MQSAYDFLTRKHSWYLHASDPANFEDIKAGGLETRFPGGSVPDIVKDRFGTTAKQVLCLRPIGTEDPTGSRSSERFLLAVERNFLPLSIGLDWSFVGTWTLPDILRADDPKMTDDEIFYEVVRRRGSVLSYDGIPASNIRVWCKGSGCDAPSTWPRLVASTISDIVRI
ncbi:hypothetical protein X743_14445 [Mesorhizobium sp. LNHC252B00]|nr:hypothetical protein X743_14445 [Mesorhizobium sp. LNHC252B00]